MKDDPTIKRIRKVRHQISERHDHNPMQLIAHNIEREKHHRHRFIYLTVSNTREHIHEDVTEYVAS